MTARFGATPGHARYRVAKAQSATKKSPARGSGKKNPTRASFGADLCVCDCGRRVADLETNSRHDTPATKPSMATDPIHDTDPPTTRRAAPTHTHITQSAASASQDASPAAASTQGRGAPA